MAIEMAIVTIQLGATPNSRLGPTLSSAGFTRDLLATTLKRRLESNPGKVANGEPFYQGEYMPNANHTLEIETDPHGGNRGPN